MELTDRARDILKVLIREYVRTGKPVGSRRLAKLHHEGLSPATIRNVTADLEEMGFLCQPHVSAGRVPTARGYRFYVDALLETKRLRTPEVDRIRRSLEEETDPGELMSKTSEILSTFSDNVGFVLAPAISMTPMRHIEFVRISKKRFLVILVTERGLVQHRFVELDQDLTQTELDQASRYLVAHFEGKTLPEIRAELINLMSEEKSLYDRLLKNVILLGAVSFMGSEDAEEESKVYLGGTAQIIEKPELSDMKRMVMLFQTFEKKSVLVKIITECLKADPSGPTVMIGLEKHLPGMRDWAVISSPYAYQQKTIGGLGILGPSRMEYEKAISLVDYVAKLFSQLLSSN